MNSRVVKQGDSYAIHHLSDDGSVRAVRPTDRAVYRLWKALQDQVDELHAKLVLADDEARKFRAATLAARSQARSAREAVVAEVRKILAEPNLATETIEQLGLWLEDAEDSAKEVAKSPRNAPQI